MEKKDWVSQALVVVVKSFQQIELTSAEQSLFDSIEDFMQDDITIDALDWDFMALKLHISTNTDHQGFLVSDTYSCNNFICTTNYETSLSIDGRVKLTWFTGDAIVNALKTLADAQENLD